MLLQSSARVTAPGVDSGFRRFAFIVFYNESNRLVSMRRPSLRCVSFSPSHYLLMPEISEEKGASERQRALHVQL